MQVSEANFISTSANGWKITLGLRFTTEKSELEACEEYLAIMLSGRRLQKMEQNEKVKRHTENFADNHA